MSKNSIETFEDNSWYFTKSPVTQDIFLEKPTMAFANSKKGQINITGFRFVVDCRNKNAIWFKIAPNIIDNIEDIWNDQLIGDPDNWDSCQFNVQTLDTSNQYVRDFITDAFEKRDNLGVYQQ